MQLKAKAFFRRNPLILQYLDWSLFRSATN